MGYVMIGLIFILRLILHECRESVLSDNANDISVKLFVADGILFLIKLSTLHLGWRQVFGQVMHMTDLLSVLDNSDPESL